MVLVLLRSTCKSFHPDEVRADVCAFFFAMQRSRPLYRLNMLPGHVFVRTGSMLVLISIQFIKLAFLLHSRNERLARMI